MVAALTPDSSRSAGAGFSPSTVRVPNWKTSSLVDAA